MQLVSQFYFICLIVLKSPWCISTPLPYCSHLSWWVKKKIAAIFFFNLQNLLHLGFLALQILMLRMLLALIYSCNPFFKVSVLSKHRIRNCSVIISQTSFWLVILHFYVAVQSALKSLCNDLATSTFWNACELASYICAYIEDVYTFLWVFSKCTRAVYIFKRFYWWKNYQTKFCLNRYVWDPPNHNRKQWTVWVKGVYKQEGTNIFYGLIMTGQGDMALN